MPPIEISAGSSVRYARTSAFSELDHRLIGHPKSQRGAAAHKPTASRSSEEELSASAADPFGTCD